VANREFFFALREFSQPTFASGNNPITAPNVLDRDSELGRDNAPESVLFISAAKTAEC